MQKYSCNEKFFSADNEASLYWAGFIVADGCLRIKKSQYSNIKILEVSLGTGEKEHLEKFKSAIEYNGPIYSRYIGDSKIDGHRLYNHHLTIASSGMYDDLVNRFEIHPNKTNLCNYPDRLKHKLSKDFLRGYFDGDGGFYLSTSKRKTPQMTMRICGTLEFLEQYKVEIETATDIVSNSKPYMYNGQGSLNYSGNISTRKIADFLYRDSNIYMSRKKKQAEEIIVSFHFNISKDKLIDIFKEKGSYTAVACYFNCSERYIKQLAKKYDLVQFCKGNIKRKKIEGRQKPDKAQLEKAFDELGSITKVAHRFAYSTDSIRNFMKEYDIY